MKVIEEHHSSDGSLTLVVGRSPKGDTVLGFDGFAWHTHADVLASLSGLPEDAAVRLFVDNLLNNRSIIAIARVGSRIRDVWVAESTTPDRYKPAEETIEFRYWNGESAV